jgi:alpha-L-arabinofuranosidase
MVQVWGYWTDDGLGMLEVLMMAEDVGAVPLLVVNAGCGVVSGPSFCVSDGAELDGFVQDALDAVEYATGAADTPWGARRAAGGHAAPFALQAFAIGNENCGGSMAKQYAANFLRIATAVRAAHPALRLVLGCETQEQMLAVTEAQPGVLALADMYDVHQRKDPRQMLAAAHEFDVYPREGAPKLFVSEYSSPRTLYPNSTTLAAALAEAVYMAGMEANADVVELATYGDLMANADDDHGSAGVSTISINAAGSFGSPSWVVQKLFMAAQPHVLVPSVLAVEGQPVIGWKNGGTCNAGSSSGGGGGGGGRGEVGGKYDDDGDVGATMLAASVSLAADGAVQAKLINYGGQPANVTVQLELPERHATAAPMTAELSLVTGESTDVNSFVAPRHVAIEHRSGVPILDGGRVDLALPPWSGSVLVVRGVD